MSSFKIRDKIASHHPWETIIKNEYANKIKFGHNSIFNPAYPAVKHKVPDKVRLKITVIGNMVTKEFIYCVNLVKGLYKYRWKNFETPVIKGVTSVEWPKIWNDLKLQYGGTAYCLSSQVAVLVNDKFYGGEKELKELIENNYIYHIVLDYYKEGVDQFAQFVDLSKRPCAYLHISIDDIHIGTLIFMLYADLVPNTCENFLRLCKTKKGGYSGTPIHRIVKDSWIQCGGFGLKAIDLDCENFIVPHDKRGVLCMANDGRHTDCSTQFFVLLQPAPWMARQYVAFGQLIDGESTLKAIELVPTWYESPTSEIIMYESGILNLECQDIMINKGTNEYIQKHIEDLIALGKILYEELLEKVFLEAQMRYGQRLIQEQREEASVVEEESALSIRETQRFIRKKDDIAKQLQKSSIASEEENNEFDVEVYEYEQEESSYKHVSLAGTSNIVVNPEKPYYIALTDVPYPGEVDSTFDLKKMLRGDYCLESDLLVNNRMNAKAHNASYASEVIGLEQSQHGSTSSLDSNDDMEIKKYLKQNVDRVSFAGSVVRSIARGMGKVNIFEDARKSELITDDECKKIRKVLIDASTPENKEQHKIKRRQTGFLRPEDLERVTSMRLSNRNHVMPEEEESTTTVRKVRIAPSVIATQNGTKPNRKPTGFIKPVLKESDLDIAKQSALSRLYDDFDITHEEDTYGPTGPTLKDYKPLSEVPPKNIFLTYSPYFCIKNDEGNREKYLRQIPSENLYEHALGFQHGKRVARKISSDYVKTMDQLHNRGENSIRSIEFARTRPIISVSEYQLKNQKYIEGNNSATKIITVMPQSSFAKKKSSGGITTLRKDSSYSSVKFKALK